MRKLATYLVIALLIAASAFAASVSRDMPARADPGSVITVTFRIDGATANEVFAIEDKLPDGWTVSDWSVTGAKEAKDKITTRFQAPLYAWSFTPSGSSASLTYTVTAPSAEGSYSFDAVWFDRSGQSRSTQAVAVRAVRCGDGICEGAENSDSCLQDCPAVTTTLAVPADFTTTTLEIEQPPAGNLTWLWVMLGVVAVLLVLALILRKKHEKSELPKI